MTEAPQLCATDKEVFDVLMSRKKSLSDATLHGLAQDRRVFCSKQLERAELCDYLSTIPYDYNDLQTVIERSEPSARGERSTFVTFDGDIDPEQIRQAIQEYASAGGVEKLSIPMHAPASLTAKVNYTDFDFSRTRLAQRIPKEATLVFSKSDGKTTVRLPSNERARSIVDGIRRKLESVRAEKVEAVELNLGRLDTADLRTRFFTKLISAVPEHRLNTVVGLKVASFDSEDTDDEDGTAVVEPEVLTSVKRASLTGENLMATPQFQSLQEAGFFICAVRWQSQQTAEPRDMIQFDVSLENPVSGTGLRYLVRHAPAGAPSAHFKKLEDIRERNHLALVEATARSVLDELVADSEDGPAA